MREYFLHQTMSLLSRTPATLDALLRDLPDQWTSGNEGEGTWNVFEVMGHLVYTERAEWIPQVRMVLTYGESRTFVCTTAARQRAGDR